MNKARFLRRTAMLLCLLLWMTSTVNTTFGYIVTATESLINTFLPEKSCPGTLTLEKLVEHPYGEDYVIPENVAFDFEIHLGSTYAGKTLSTSAGERLADANGTLTATLRPGTPFSVYDVATGTPVTVNELPTTLEGFSPKGETTQEITIAEDAETLLQFTNTYTPAPMELTDVLVTGIKYRNYTTWERGDTFSYRLESLTGDARTASAGSTWHTLATRTIKYDPTDPEFNTFDFSSAMEHYTVASIGVYYFRMTEILLDQEHHEYDGTVNPFEVHIEDEDMDGHLEIYTVTTAENGEVTVNDGIYLVNVSFYDFPVPQGPADVTANLSINKYVENIGEATVGAEGFNFLLENLTNGQKTTLTSDTLGEASALLTFTADDIGKTYSYRLSEIDQGIEDITYDTTVYTFTVTVSATEENTLALEISHPTLTFEFRNVADRAIVKPGDPPNLFWLITMLLSGTAFVALFVYDRKKRLPL